MGRTEGEMEVACGDGGRELRRMFERNTATRVSERPETSAICKNNLSNYEEGPLASPVRRVLLYAHLTRPLAARISVCRIYI